MLRMRVLAILPGCSLPDSHEDECLPGIQAARCRLVSVAARRPSRLRMSDRQTRLTPPFYLL